jgi:phage/plasmid-like protein (TIGR03299 family)
MAHEIRNSDGLALFQNPAWHGLGNVIQHAMSPTQALELAGLDWEVGFPDSQAAYFGKTSVPIQDSRTLYRIPRDGKVYADGTPEQYLEVGTHGLQYSPLQNKDFFEIAYALGDKVKVESAGSLFDGRRIFVLIRGETIEMKGDKMVTYLLLTTSHDGTLSLSAVPTSVRVVCNNTLGMAINRGAKRMYKITHKGGMRDQIREMEIALGRFKETGDLFAKSIGQLQEAKITNQKMLLDFWTQAYLDLTGGPKDEETKDKFQKESVAVLDSWTTSMEAEMLTLNYAEPDLWVAANAVTGWLQHSDPKKVMRGWEERRLFSNWAGTNLEKSANVMALAMDFAK